jgi:hypothetical protein
LQRLYGNAAIFVIGWHIVVYLAVSWESSLLTLPTIRDAPVFVPCFFSLFILPTIRRDRVAPPFPPSFLVLYTLPVIRDVPVPTSKPCFFSLFTLPTILPFTSNSFRYYVILYRIYDEDLKYYYESFHRWAWQASTAEFQV